MNYGRFFSLDHESSLFQNGIAVYYYREVKDQKNNDTDDLSSKFPIYLTISKQSLDFRAHYYSNINEEPYHTHLHNLILSLPISTNLEIKDRLTEVLTEAYDTNFPNNSNKENDNQFNENRNYLFNLISNLEISKPNQGNKSTWYSNLYVFANNQEKKDGSNKVNWFLRKLILDFMFDLEHTKVFQTSPYYEYISIKLRENFFFSALADKANFYYNRKITEEYVKRKEEEEEERVTQFYAEQLLKAEAIWTKSIRNPKSDIDFNASNGWFDYPEKELNEIYTSEERKEENNFYSRLEENSLWRISNLLSSKWYVKRYAFLSLFRLIYKSAWVIFSYYILILGIIILTGIKLINQENFSSFESIILYITFVTVILGFIFIRQGDAQKRFHGLHLFMPRLLVAVIAGWVTIFLGTDMLGFNPSKMVGSPNILLSSTEGILNLELKGNEPQPTIYQNIIHNGGCRFFSLIASISVCILIFIYYQIGKCNPYGRGRTKTSLKSNSKKNYTDYQVNRIISTLIFFMIGFCYSYIIAIFLSFLFSEYSQALPNEFILYTFFAMFIGIFIQLTFEEKLMTEEL